ncbi:MerC domain-containing protein [Ferrimonas lipolytica]|uniref:MerC domain-containing protein n=1 Tax=Ferrimonas lipolytica TaxID=2724191 RepID=A0A6H1UEJ7_9GAMM|nr:MerC domain-containing protein [Ferrimonas lipolytica]QIZ76763.1 MerC domain-containing protein [Ferrimonas lipolytica]
MSIEQKALDQASIGLSLICVVHCLATPALLLLGLSVPSVMLEEQHFHQMILFVVLPLSGLALFLGCRKHRNFSVLSLGLSGLAILVVASLWVHHWYGHDAETVLTIIGSILMVIAHGLNFKQCRASGCQH